MNGMDNDAGNLLTGMYTLKNGFTFYGAFISVDGGPNCAFVIIYFDGKKLRAYTPTYGNTVNVDFNCILGGEADCDADWDEIERKYRKLGIWNDDLCEDGLHVMYLEKYNLDEDTFYYNWDAIRQDIETYIEVV